MKIGFFLVGDNEDYFTMAERMIESAREVMPDVQVYHLTDENTREIDDVDGTHVLKGNMPMAVRRMLHHSFCDGEWLFVDCDVIFQKDVREVFDDNDFDVALTDRDGTITNEAKYAAIMPYNIGVTFSRSKGFWMNIAKMLEGVPLRFQEWAGDQHLVCELVLQKKMPFKVKVLPGYIYNYPPKHAGDGAHASIVHYKGQRKRWLIEETA